MMENRTNHVENPSQRANLPTCQQPEARPTCEKIRFWEITPSSAHGFPFFGWAEPISRAFADRVKNQIKKFADFHQIFAK
jgi:hypothetical protein